MAILAKICRYFECSVDDILDVLPEKEIEDSEH